MTKNMRAVWQKQHEALRNPSEILGGPYSLSGLYPESLRHTVDDGFQEVLKKLGVTLFVSREYEHLVMSLSIVHKKLRQGFLHLPHPAGLAVNRKTNSVFVAATRNPNQIWEFKPMTKALKRKEVSSIAATSYLMPTRTKVFPGAYYFHDLSVVGNKLYATSVGQNAIVPIQFDKSRTDEPQWWPKAIENQHAIPDHTANYLQLNSISGGSSLEQCFFSASSDRKRRQRPGDINFPVDGTGVLFSGKTREVYATGLTRPHSARLYKRKVWVDNSGYGTVGFVEDGQYKPQFSLPGWTRGLCFINDYMFVGVSRVLPRFYMYAPGLDAKRCQTCGIYVYNLATGTLSGSLTWPYGNQLFAIDYIDTAQSVGFAEESVQLPNEEIMQQYYQYKVE